MIEKRVLFKDADGPAWTTPIRNQRALEALEDRFIEYGVPYQVFPESIGGPMADGSFQRFLSRPGSGRMYGRMTWGHGDCFTCAMVTADQPTAEKFLVDPMPPVIGGFPLLDMEPSEREFPRVANIDNQPPRFIAIIRDCCERFARWLLGITNEMDAVRK